MLRFLFFVTRVSSSFVGHIKPCHQHLLPERRCNRFSSLITSVGEFHTHFYFFQKPVKQRPAWFRDEKNILAIVPFGWYLTYPVYNMPWRRLWNQAKGGRCYHNYVVHNGSRRADIDNNISENWLQKQILLCMAQSVSQILLEQFILAWAPLACSNTMAALCSTLWPQSVSHKKCWHIAEQVYFYPLYVLSLNHVTWK